MSTFKILAGTAFAALALGAAGAQAADMPQYIEPEAVAVIGGGWYLRGDIGASHQVSDDIDSPYFDEIVAGGGSVDLYESEWDPSVFLGFGFGYQFNEWFRADITGEYRFKSDFHGLDSYVSDDGTPPAGVPGPDLGANEYTGNKSEWVVLANAYVDLPAWGIMKPFIGAGVGAARVKIDDFEDQNLVVDAAGFSSETATWNLAWALHAGLAFEIDRNWTVEIAYRYLHMGDAETENLLTAEGDDDVFNPFSWDNIASHDIKLGVRYVFD